MYPILLQFGDVIVPSWHVFFALAAISAFVYANRANQKENLLTPQILGTLFLVCYVAGYFGARIFAILVEEPPLAGVGDFLNRLFSFGAMTFYGGFIGCVGAGVLYCWRHRINTLAIADIGLPAGLLALAVGRIGCFLNGDDYGIPVVIHDGTIPWWAVSFPNHEDPIPRYPVQLMEAVLVLFLVIIATRMRPALKRDFFAGATALFITAAYAVLRFFLEYLRGDPRGWEAQDLSPAQYVSIGILLVTITIASLRVRLKV